MDFKNVKGVSCLLGNRYESSNRVLLLRTALHTSLPYGRKSSHLENGNVTVHAGALARSVCHLGFCEDSVL